MALTSTQHLLVVCAVIATYFYLRSSGTKKAHAPPPDVTQLPTNLLGGDNPMPSESDIRWGATMYDDEGESLYQRRHQFQLRPDSVDDVLFV